MSAFAFDLSLATDWLGTFAVHSTLALGAAWLVTSLLRGRALAVQEALLRTALWLPLASASAQCALRGVWTPELVFTAERPAAPLVPQSANEQLAAGAPVATAGEGVWWSQLPWPTVALVAAVAASLCGLVWLFWVHHRLRRVLRARRPETDARVLTTAAEVARGLGLQQSPHVSRSAAIATPIAFGLVRPEICLPERVGELGGPSLRAMLAHEVAHLRGSDPAWMWGAAWLQALFPWQPLFVAVRARWARLVELRCDAIAAEHATPTAVARCLLDVAEWLRPGPEATVAALGMAARPSALRERVEAVLRGGPFRPASRGVARAMGGLALTALTAGAPAVATGEGIDAAAVPALAAPSAPDVAPAVDRAALRRALTAMQQEHEMLLAEADRVRADLRTSPLTPELAQSQATLDRRLGDLERLRTRLEALLARIDSRDH